MSEKKILDLKRQIIETGKTMYRRHLTDSLGGNISVRFGDLVLITPTHSAQQWRWNLKPEDIITLNLSGNIVSGKHAPSSESSMHLEIYRQIGEAGGVIHAHPKYVLGFSAAGVGLEPILEQARGLGNVPVLRYAPRGSDELASIVAESAKKYGLRRHGLAMILKDHGIVTIGPNLIEAYIALEISQELAWTTYMTKVIKS